MNITCLLLLCLSTAADLPDACISQSILSDFDSTIKIHCCINVGHELAEANRQAYYLYGAMVCDVGME
jgi:hypothetical protein